MIQPTETNNCCVYVINSCNEDARYIGIASNNKRTPNNNEDIFKNRNIHFLSRFQKETRIPVIKAIANSIKKKMSHI